MSEHIGTLYIVAGPIGNLDDITVRAAKLLTEIEYVICEDTRHSGILLEHLRNTYLKNPLAVPKPRLISYYEENEEKRVPEILKILKQGKDMALISDAGTPAISDPGFTIIRGCIREQINVVGLPGASSAILALVVSGLPTDKFTFLGFLPGKKGNAIKLLEKLKETRKYLETTLIIFESPNRLLSTLQLIKALFGDIDIVICKELTKIHERVYRGTINTMLSLFEGKSIKGEYVILFR